MNILTAIRDRKVFGAHFKGSSWDAWKVFLAALFALTMPDAQLAIYQQCTGRSVPPCEPAREGWLVCGRRAGKSFILATIAVFLACFRDWRPYLAPGEVATVMVVAADRKQARVIMRYCLGLLKSVPMLRQQIEGVTRESIRLAHRVVIEIHTASFRSTRGYTIVSALLDELAFWEVDESSANPDIEVINAIRSAMATIPGALLLCASSPHARRGALWNAFRKHHGKDGPILIWQARTRVMNPSVPQSFIDEHIAEDPARAEAEYLAQFRSDLEEFVSREILEACISHGVFERRRQYQRAYFAFTDPSGGSSDSMCLCIAHVEHNRETICIDALREVRAPFSPEIVCSEFAATLKQYGLSTVTGDRYAGEWPREQFLKFGVHYHPAHKPKSELYLDLLPLLNSRRIDLLDNSRALSQILNLEKMTARGGRDSIDHPPGQKDDLANVIAGCASLGVGRAKYSVYALADMLPNDGTDPGAHSREEWRRLRRNLAYSSGFTIDIANHNNGRMINWR
jgi:hypothetical protein